MNDFRNSNSPVRPRSSQSNYLAPNGKQRRASPLISSDSPSSQHQSSGRSTPIFGFGRRTPTLSSNGGDATSSRSG